MNIWDERSRDSFKSLLCLAQVDNNGVRVCPRVLRLSVNIKDTAGCCVFRGQVSVHKQLINKSHTSLSRCVCLCVFSVLWAVSVTARRPQCSQVFITHTAAAATGTMTQLWRSFARHGLIFHTSSGVSWHVSGCEWIRGRDGRLYLDPCTLPWDVAHAERLFAHRILPPDPPHVWRLCALPAGVSALSGESQRPDEGDEGRGQHRWGLLQLHGTFTFDLTLDSWWDIDACPLLTRSAEREEEFTLTETTPASQSPESYSPARSVHSVGVSSASSPTEAVSPEYTGVASTTGDSHRDVLNKQMSHYTSFLCANTALFCP